MEALKVQRSSWRKERKVESVQNQNIDLCKVGGGVTALPERFGTVEKLVQEAGALPEILEAEKKMVHEMGNGVQHKGKWV